MQYLAALPDEDQSQVSKEQVVEALGKAFKAVDDAVLKVRGRLMCRTTAAQRLVFTRRLTPVGPVCVHADPALELHGVDGCGGGGAVGQGLPDGQYYHCQRGGLEGSAEQEGQGA